MQKVCSAILMLLWFSAHAEARSRVGTHFLASDTSPQAEWIVSPMLGFLPFAAVEVGGKVSYEFATDGFIGAINDSVSAEGGLFIGKYRGDSSTYLSGNMRWDFHLVPEWTVFAAPGFSLRTIEGKNSRGPGASFQVGGFWNIQPNLALRADIDLEDVNPRAGVAFRF